MSLVTTCAKLLLQILFFGWLSEKLDQRLLVAAASNVWMLPFFVGLVGISPTTSPWIRYALLTGINGIPYTHSILVGMTSKNAKGVARRTCSAAVYNMCYQVGSIIAVNVYRKEDAPLCKSFHVNPLLRLILIIPQTTPATRPWLVSAAPTLFFSYLQSSTTSGATSAWKRSSIASQSRRRSPWSTSASPIRAQYEAINGRRNRRPRRICLSGVGSARALAMMRCFRL